MSFDRVMDFLLLLASAAAVVAYLCRLDMLTYKGHKPAVVLMHACLGAACAFAGNAAARGQAEPGDWFTVAGALLWIVLSYTSWRGQVPAHFDSSPVPLDGAPATRPPG